MASGVDLQMSEDKARYYRYISLLNDGGKLVLLEKYEALVPNNDILLNLQQQKHKIRTLPLRKHISDTQYDLLYPASGQADPSTFDLTLLTFLLRSTCCLQAKSAAWDPQTPPVDSDISVEADVARLRNLRNKLIGHPENTAMSVVEFEDHWQSLKKILLRLGSSIPDLEDRIDDLKDAAMEPARERELQAVKASWAAAENLLHGAVADLREDVDQLQTSTKRIKSELDGVKEAVKEAVILQSLMQDSKEFLEDCEADEVYVKTEDYDKAKKKILDGGYIVISGLAGEGKTTMAKHLVRELSSSDACLVLQSPDEWEKWNSVDYKKYPIDYLVIDDIFGSGAMNRSWVKTWETNLKKVQRRMKKANFKLIITTRQYILQEAKHVGNFGNFFESNNVVNLSSKTLSREDLYRILMAHLKKNRRVVQPSFVESCIDSYRPISIGESSGSAFGFPQSVGMFVSNDDLFNQGPDFFSNPKRFYMAFLEGVLRDEDHDKILALILTWARGRRSVRRDDLQPPHDKLERIAEYFGFTLKNTATLKKVLEFLEHHTDDIFDYRPTTGSYTFDHNVIKDMVGLVLCKGFPKQTLYYASRDFILEYVTTDASKKDKYHFHVEEYMYGKLSEKLRKLLFPDKPRSKDVNVNHLRNGGRCPNMVMPTMEVDVDISTIDAFQSEKFVRAFVQYEQDTFGETLLFDKPAMTMSGYFLGRGMEMEPISLCLPDYCLLNDNPLILTEQMIMRPRQSLDIPLTFAVRRGLKDTIRLLLDVGAVATTETVYLAAVQEDTGVIEMLISRNEALGTSETFKIINGNSPLIASAKKGLLKSVKVLVEKGADIKYRNANGLRALDKAVLFKHTDVCEVLLGAGSPVNERHGKFKRTPLHVASDNGSVDIVRMLLRRGAKVDIKDHRGHYPIHCAAFRGHTKVVEALLKHDPSLSEQIITSYGSESVIRGWTVYHIAVWRNNHGLMQMLVNSGTNPSVSDCYGRTPLCVAAHDGKCKLVELLLPHSNPNEADKKGRTPLHVALMKGHWPVATLLCFENGVNVNTMDKDGTTPLHEACKRAFKKDHVTMVKDMVSRYGADYLIRDKQGRTAYDVATPRVRSAMEEHFYLRH